LLASTFSTFTFRTYKEEIKPVAQAHMVSDSPLVIKSTKDAFTYLKNQPKVVEFMKKRNASIHAVEYYPYGWLISERKVIWRVVWHDVDELIKNGGNFSYCAGMIYADGKVEIVYGRGWIDPEWWSMAREAGILELYATYLNENELPELIEYFDSIVDKPLYIESLKISQYLQVKIEWWASYGYSTTNSKVISLSISSDLKASIKPENRFQGYREFMIENDTVKWLKSYPDRESSEIWSYVKQIKEVVFFIEEKIQKEVAFPPYGYGFMPINPLPESVLYKYQRLEKPVREIVVIGECDVKFRGEIIGINGADITSIYTINVSDVLEDPSGNLKAGMVAYVTFSKNFLNVGEVKVGDLVEVYGAFKGIEDNVVKICLEKVDHYLTGILILKYVELAIDRPRCHVRTFYQDWSSFTLNILYLPPTKEVTANITSEKEGFMIKKGTPTTKIIGDTLYGVVGFNISIGKILPPFAQTKGDVTFKVSVSTTSGKVERTYSIKVLSDAKLKEDVQALAWMVTPIYQTHVELCLLSATENPYVKSDVEAFVKEKWGDIKDPYQLVKKITAWVHGALHYDSSPIAGFPTPFWKLWKEVKESYGNVHGDCTDYSILLTGMLRAIGIQARVVSCLLGPEDSLKGFQVGHDFVEVFLDGKWVHADPTWGKYDEPQVYEEEYGMLFALASALVDRTSYYHGFAPDP
jgi:hypothetical protein